MTFHSILFARAEDRAIDERPEAPAFFADLNLDQVITAITAGRQAYDLKPFFYAPLHDADSVYYRHEIMRDLENKSLLESIKLFSERMVIVRRYLALIGKLEFKHHKAGWWLEAAAAYCAAVAGLARDLGQTALSSRGLLEFRAYLTSYTRSPHFASLAAEAQQRKAELAGIRYCVTFKGSAVSVRKYEAEADYSAEVEKTFERFKQGAVEDHRARLAIAAGMNHVEAQILDSVARLYPDVFTGLDRFCAQHSDFLDGPISAFSREIQFYVAYLEYIAKLKQAGLAFCYPQVSDSDKQTCVKEGFDLALATKRVAEATPIVCNDFYLKGPERIIVVSGPNQGGKTTFARMFGQLHTLASLGCPVPGREAQLFLCDTIFTHFEEQEDIQNLHGKLQDDLIRIHAILDQATPRSIVIMNEIFTSTTLADAVFLSEEIMARIIQLDALCVCVTFIDELASLSASTVSMVSTVLPEDPAVRTYKIVRKPADGLAYALSIAEKHRLTYGWVKERIKP